MAEQAIRPHKAKLISKTCRMRAPGRLLLTTRSCHGVSYSENVTGRLWPKKAILEANGDHVCLSEVVHTICTAIDSHLDIGQGRQMPLGLVFKDEGGAHHGQDRAEFHNDGDDGILGFAGR